MNEEIQGERTVRSSTKLAAAT